MCARPSYPPLPSSFYDSRYKAAPLTLFSLEHLILVHYIAQRFALGITRTQVFSCGRKADI